MAGVGSNILVGMNYGDRAYLYDGETFDLLHQFSGTWGYFGFSVAGVGSNVLVGTQEADKAYLYDGETYELLHEFSGSGFFGQSVAGVGSNILVGTGYGNKAYLYDGETFELLHTFEDLSGNPDAGFGHLVAGAGSNILVGSYSGKAYLYDGEHHITTVAGVTLESEHDLDGMVVRPAGRVNGGKGDFFITAESSSAVQYGTYLVFGEALSDGILELESTATHLNMTAMKGVGDLNRDGFDDVGAAVFEASDALEGAGQVQHQVVQVFLGSDDAPARFSGSALYPDLVFEPDVFKAPDGTPDAFVFAGVGFVSKSDDTVVIDSGQAVVSTTGAWTAEGGVQTGEAREANLSFTWRFQGLDPDRTYNLRVSIPAAGDLNFDLSRLARYEVRGESLKTVLFDQQEAANQASQGVPAFYHLGAFRPDAEGNISVTLKPEPRFVALP